MASTPGRDRRPDALSRLRSSPAPWTPGEGAGPPITGTVDEFIDERIDGDASAPPPSDWGLTSPPRWLTDESPALDGADPAVRQPDRQGSVRRSATRRRGPFVAPPAAVALIAVGVLACVVTAYTVFSGPSDDSPAAARVAFPASAGAAAPSGSDPAPDRSAGQGPASSSAVPRSTAPSSAPPSPTAAEELVVSVVGLVRSPGLVRLPGAARVADAIGRAGGGRPGADLLGLNMAQPLRDGDQILVGFADPAGGAGMRSAIVAASSSSGSASPSSGAVPTATGSAAPAAAAAGPVNLNTADEAELDTLPGVGPVTAKAIIDWRTRNGQFTSVDQLGEVDGIGPGRLAKLRDRVTV